MFDQDIIMHINAVFMTLRQLGVGPTKGFSISDKTKKWFDFLPETDGRIDAVKTYVGMKVRLAFDPPSSSIVTETLNRMIGEAEWRLNVESETPTGKEETLG